MSNPSVPWKTREEIIQAFLTMKRSQEELALLQSDMICTVKYWHPRIQNLVEQLKAQEYSEDQYIRGTNSMLRKWKRDAELQCQKAISLFSAFVMISSDISVRATESTIETDESDDDLDEYSTDEEDSWF